MKKKKTIKRLRRLTRRLARNGTRLRYVLMRIAYHDLEGNDPLAICTVRQWAKEELDRTGEN